MTAPDIGLEPIDSKPPNSSDETTLPLVGAGYAREGARKIAAKSRV